MISASLNEEKMARPRLVVLGADQVEQVHEYSLRILESVGVRVDSEQGRVLLCASGGTVEGDRVLLPRPTVEWSLEVAPSSVEVYDRSGDLAFELPGPPRFGIGVTALYYQDPKTDELVPFNRRHVGSLTRLGDALPSYDAVSTVGIVQDAPPETSDLYATLEMVANTTKPLVLLVSADEAFRTVINLLEHLCGDLASRPFVLPYLNPISPLVINRGTIDKMRVAAECGLPVVYSSYGMAGASTPITPAGTLALLNAELLAGLVLSQSIREGMPVMLGGLPAYFDMKGMGSFYAPRSYLVDLACAEMMAHYQLPHCGTSGSGMGWGADLIASGHQWFNHLVSCAGKVGLVPFVGDTLGSKAFSPATIVYANEVIEQARRFSAGFRLDDESVALDEIGETGPGGSFLMRDLTLQLFRSAYYSSDIFPRLTLEEWHARGRPTAEQTLRDHTEHLLHSVQPPADHYELIARGEAFVSQAIG